MSDTPETLAAPPVEKPVVDRMAAARAARAANKAKADAERASAVAPAPAETPAAAPTPLAQPASRVDQISPAGPTTMEKAAATDQAKRDAKIAALRAAKLAGADPASEPVVTARVTKKGHGQISMGEHISGLGDLTYDHGETPSFPQSIAQDLEDRGFVEIQ